MGIRRETDLFWETREIYFSHWFLTLVYLTVWLTSLVFWQQRKHRAARGLQFTP
ncbi:hypothetical protein [Haloferula helveola]|uniref:hypothetical protein n=1 Tax=Haloferula helveola TaxID=490095 RepID=UPI00333FECDF